MKRILFLIPNLSVGGAEKVLVNLATSPSEQSKINHKKYNKEATILPTKDVWENNRPETKPDIIIINVIVLGLTLYFIHGIDINGDINRQTKIHKGPFTNDRTGKKSRNSFRFTFISLTL